MSASVEQPTVVGAAGADLDIEYGEQEVQETFPILQPPEPRVANYFVKGDRGCLKCCPWYLICAVPMGAVCYVFGFVLLVLVALLLVTIYVCCGYLACAIRMYLSSWRHSPWDFRSSLYVQATYLTYQFVLLNRQRPTSGPECMPLSMLKEKKQLETNPIHYATNIKVPRNTDEEFKNNKIAANSFVQWLEENLSALIPLEDDFKAFEPGQNPVEYVMRQLGSVFPDTYQVWEDKKSDIALGRFCLHGLGAHRIQVEQIDGVRHFVVRANMLSMIPVRKGYERYGGDCYFDESWRPVKIVDSGLGPLRDDGTNESVTVRPGDPEWERTKFRFRSSLSVLVTLVDHLYGVHLQASNIFVTALREQLSPNHPIRRFMTPFTYQTISVNDNARNNLAQIDSMGPRCFAFTDAGFRMAFAAAPKLLMSGLEVPKEEGGPILDRMSYVQYLKGKGIDTEYYRQSQELCRIFLTFISDYMAYYYPTSFDVVADYELMAFLRQYVYQLEVLTLEQLPTAAMPHELKSECLKGMECFKKHVESGEDHTQLTPESAEAMYQFFLIIFVEFMFVVTAGHEQVGAVGTYVQDVSFCAFRWTPGAMMGTMQTATNQALLMSFTSTPMPKLLGTDWSHLFPSSYHRTEGAKHPVASFRAFQEQLQAMSEKCDAYDAAVTERSYPENFPMYVINPKYLETSISV